MSARLAGKVCIVTGTGGSMGRATALAFAREGEKLVGPNTGPPVRIHHHHRLRDLGGRHDRHAAREPLYRRAPRGAVGEMAADLVVPRVRRAGAITLVALAAAPQTSTPAPPQTSSNQPAGSRRSVRLPVPAAAATLAAFAANGLFAGLSGLFLGTTLHHPSHALSGATLFLVFIAGVASQLATGTLPASRVLGLGTISMLIRLVLLVVAVRLSTPSLALFLIGGALIGADAGAVFKGTTGIVLEAAAPEDRVAMTSALLIALFVGLSVPVIGAGTALNQRASAPDTVLGFATVVALGVSGSGSGPTRRRSHPHQPNGVAESHD